MDTETLTCSLPEDENHQHNFLCYGTWELNCMEEEHTHDESCYVQAEDEVGDEAEATEAAEQEAGTDDGTKAAEVTKEAESEKEEKVGPIRRIMKAVTNTDDGEAIAVNESESSLELPVNSIEGEGTTYDPATGEYTTELEINFSFQKESVRAGVDYEYTYPEGVLIPDDLLGIQKQLDDKNGTPAGTYTFVKNANGTYSVKVKFDQTYLDTAQNTIEGFASFKGKLKTQTDDNGNIKITDTEHNLEINIPSKDITYPDEETDKYDISVHKAGSYVKDGNKLVYTVYVRSRKGTPGPIEFHDVITSDIGLALGSADIKVEQGTFEYHNQNDQREPNNLSTVSISPSINNNGKISMELPQLNAGTQENGYFKGNCYKITYTYNLGEQKITHLSANNEAKAESKDQKTGKTIKDEYKIPVNVDYRYAMNKSGSYENGKLKWRITLNDNRMDITNAVLTDDMLGQIANGTNISVNPDKGYELQREDGKITGIKFNQVDNGPNKEYYVIEYYTDSPATSWNDQQVTNNVKFDPTPDTPGDDINTSGSITVPGTRKVNKKSSEMEISEDGTTGKIAWTVTIDIPAGGLPKGSVIKESMGYYAHGMTKDQISAWVNAWQWEGSDTNITLPIQWLKFKDQDNKEKSYQEVQNDDNTVKYTYFECQLSEDLKSPNNKDSKLIATYYTTVDLTKNTSNEMKYRNDIWVDSANAGDDYVYYKSNMVKTDGSGQTGTTQISSQDGKLTWKVKVSIGEGETCKHLTVTDNLPANVLLESTSIDLSDGTKIELVIDESGNITGSNDIYKISGKYDTENNTIELTLANIDGNESIKSNTQYVFTFNCKADVDKLEELVIGKKYTFVNSATAKTDQFNFDSSTQTQEWTYTKPTEEKKIMTKTGSWDNDRRRLDYSIIINPDGDDLVKDEDTMTLVDTLSYNSNIFLYNPEVDANMEVALLQSTVKLYRAVSDGQGGLREGEEVKDWKWVCSPKEYNDYDGKKDSIITATGIPDSTPLILKYAYEVTSTIPKGREETLPIWNTAKLEGRNEQASDEGGGKKWQDQQSSAGVTTGRSYIFYKVEKGNYNKNLSGAKFSVYCCGQDGTPETTVISTYTTDNNGRFQIQWNEGTTGKPINKYSYNTLYMVKETTPPAHYKLPDQPEVYYFYFSNEEDTTHTLPENTPKSAVDLSKLGKTEYVENIHDATDIVVKKVWKDKDGNEISHNSGSIDLELYQKVNKQQGSTGGSSGGGDGTMAKVSWIGYNYTLDDNNINFTENFDSDEDYILLPVGTKITIILTAKQNAAGTPIPVLKINDSETNIEMSRVGDTQNYSCTVTIEGDTVLKSLSNYWLFDEKNSEKKLHSWKFDYPTVSTTPSDDETSESKDILKETFTLSNDNGWRAEFDSLPLSGEAEDGSTVYYSYYVKEISVPNYVTSYDNNGGITNGIITVTNQATDEPEYTLPETGGSGTTPYTAAGLGIMLTAGVMYTIKSRKGGRRFFRN